MSHPPELLEKIEAAFDYRGDVTVELTEGDPVVGFLSNRDQALGVVELLLEAGGSRRIPYEQIRDIRLTGKDYFEPFEPQ